MRIVTLCTGNASRSVMLGFMLEELAAANGLSWDVRTAGTHVVEGQAMSPRTLLALQGIDELGDLHFSRHRSHQVTNDDIDFADVVLCAEADHVAYCRARYPDASDRAVQLGSFCRYAPLDATFVDQVHDVASRIPDDSLDVADPAGGDQDAYNECARELWDLAQVFVTLTSPAPQ